MPSFHALSLEIHTPSMSVMSTSHQVISVEKLPQHTTVELIQKHFQHQDKEQWAKDRALVDTNPHAKLLITYCPLTRAWPLAREYMPWITCTAHSSTPRGPPQHLSWHTIKGDLKANEGKIKRFVGDNVLLLQLTNNKDGASDTLPGTKPNSFSIMFITLQINLAPVPTSLWLDL